MAFPRAKLPWVVRTEFGHDEGWEAICKVIRAPVPAVGDTFYANVQFVEEAELGGLGVAELLARLPGDYRHPVLFVVDLVAVTAAEYPVLVVDLLDERGRSFRAIPSTIQSVENNLSLFNMRFYEFAERVDADGIFRGIRDDA
jgi:hypothetical protein